MTDARYRFRASVLLLLLACLMSGSAWARQYKSRVFTDSEQELSASEVNNIAALEEAFASYQDDYQIASSGQYLAREMVASGEYAKAADYYYAALKSGSRSSSDGANLNTETTLAEPILKQLRRELAQVLLKLKRDDEVIMLFNTGLIDTNALSESIAVNQSIHLDFAERILMARAYLSLQQYHQVVTHLQPVTQDLKSLNQTQLQQLSGLLYQANALKLVVQVLIELRQRDPADVDTARQLTGLYIRLEQYQQALDLWSLVYAQGLLTRAFPSETDKSPQDLLLLADLYHRQKAPEKAARLLQQAMDKGTVAANADNSYRLFEFWYQAKEVAQAKTALWQSIQQSHNLQHALMLAELLQQAQDWQQLENLVLLGCETVLPDKFVGRINLFYGIALHKLGKDDDARRAFINASLVSGVKTQAREWLAFIGAASATIEESRKLWGPCLPEDPEIELPKNLTAQSEELSTKERETAKESQKQPEVGVDDLPITGSELAQTASLTELPATRLYAGRLTTTPENLQRDIKTKVFTLMKNLMRSGGRVDGKMHLVLSFDGLTEKPGADKTNAAMPLKLSVGFPYSGLPKTRAGFKIIKHPKRKALVRFYRGPAIELAIQWQMLVQQALTQGLVPTGDAVMVFESDTSGTDLLDVQLQLMIE